MPVNTYMSMKAVKYDQESNQESACKQCSHFCLKWQCCGKLSYFEGCLIWTALLLLAGVLGIVVAWVIVTNGFQKCQTDCDQNAHKCSSTNPAACMPDYDPQKDRTCTSANCALIASHFLQNIDEEADPCSDFYQFACGKYADHSHLAETETLVSPIQDIENRQHKWLKVLFETNQPEDLESERFVKTFYQSCLNETSRRILGLPTLLHFLNELGGWPLLVGDEWSSENYSWEASSAEIVRAHGLRVVIDGYVAHDAKNTSHNVVELDQAELGLKSIQFFSNGTGTKHMRHYIQLMVETARLIGASPDRARREMQEVAEFEINLAKSMDHQVKRKNRTVMYNVFSLQSLADKYPAIDVKTYIRTLFQGHYFIPDDEVVILCTKEYFANLAGFISKTPSRVIQNYMLWRVVKTYIPLMSNEIRAPSDHFQEYFLGINQRPETWKECVDVTGKVLPMASGKIFVKRHFHQQAKSETEEMTKNIQAAFIEKLQNDVDWMDEDTKQNALAKARNLKIKIGYPDFLYNETKLMHKFRTFTLKAENVLENVVNIRSVDVAEELDSLRRTPDQEVWYTSPSAVDAYYAPNYNEIVFPAGILQFPFFAQGVPRYVSYAMIGAVIGHEVTHGFDNEGRQIDKNGNLHLWWDKTTLDLFTKKSECLINQYGDTVEPTTGQNLNGNLTLGENIADNGGVKTAFKAYNIWTALHEGADMRLPGLQHLTNEQLFFIGYANNWCSIMRMKAIEFYIDTEVHSPPKYRAVIPLQNSHEFAKAFECPLGSPMNPVHKCTVW